MCGKGLVGGEESRGEVDTKSGERSWGRGDRAGVGEERGVNGMEVVVGERGE